MFYVLIQENGSLFYVNRQDTDEINWTANIREARLYAEAKEAHYWAEYLGCQVLAIQFLNPGEEINLESGWEKYAVS
jgi:hypothetical protein